MYQLPNVGVEDPEHVFSVSHEANVFFELLPHLVLHLQPSFLHFLQEFSGSLFFIPYFTRSFDSCFIMAWVCSSNFSLGTNSSATSMISDSLFVLSSQLLTQILLMSFCQKPKLIHFVGDFFPFHPGSRHTPLVVRTLGPSIHICRGARPLGLRMPPSRRPARILPSRFFRGEGEDDGEIETLIVSLAIKGAIHFTIFPFSFIGILVVSTATIVRQKSRPITQPLISMFTSQSNNTHRSKKQIRFLWHCNNTLFFQLSSFSFSRRRIIQDAYHFDNTDVKAIPFFDSATGFRKNTSCTIFHELGASTYP